MFGKSIRCKSLAALAAALLLVILSFTKAGAWSGAETVGAIGSAAFSNKDLGSLTDDSGLGAVAADAAAYACGTELAILCGGDFAGNLAPGVLTWEQLCFAFTEDRPLAVCSVTAEQLKSLMEFCLSHMTVDTRTLSIDRAASAFGAFPQISGFRVKYDVSAPVGERVLQIVLDDKTAPAEGRVYSLVCTEYLLSGGYGPLATPIPYEPAGRTVCEALAEFIAAGRMENADYTESDRVQGIGSVDSSLVNQFGVGRVLLAVCLLIVLLIGLKYQIKNTKMDDQGELFVP